MERIDDLMERLKGQMPQVPGADALTDNIMATIEETEDRKPVAVPMWLSVIRTVSSVAAVILLMLFVRLKNVTTKTVKCQYLKRFLNKIRQSERPACCRP